MRIPAEANVFDSPLITGEKGEEKMEKRKKEKKIDEFCSSHFLPFLSPSQIPDDTLQNVGGWKFKSKQRPKIKREKNKKQ